MHKFAEFEEGMVINMENAERILLEQHGFDVDGTMKRFLNNEQLYRKCLKKFLEDGSMDELKKACAEDDIEKAFKAAHTMKGFISNLGMNKLSHLLYPLVEKLRTGNALTQDEIRELQDVYQEMYELIEKM